jgi:hypothetical protein
MAGTTIKFKIVDRTIPPTTAVPRDSRLAEPAPPRTRAVRGPDSLLSLDRLYDRRALSREIRIGIGRSRSSKVDLSHHAVLSRNAASK